MAGRELLVRTAHLVRLMDLSGGLLDEAIVICFAAGASFTGQSMAELQIHGGRAVISAVLQDLSDRGLRAADAGEFTQRAFFNGKLDLVSAEGLADLLHAQTDLQRRIAQNQYGGHPSAIFEGWRSKLLKLLAYIEANIDFSDEEHVSEVVFSGLLKGCTDLVVEMEGVLSKAKIGERFRDGFRVALIGSPNVGKSSIINRLVNRDVAIVSDIAGTTRDVVECFIDFQGIPAIISDTAGLRTGSEDQIELEGIKRSLRQADLADIVVIIGSPDQPIVDLELDSDPIWLWNKADLQSAPCDGRPWLEISAANDVGFEPLLREIHQRLVDCSGNVDDALITRDRHRQCILEALRHLQNALTFDNPDFLELFAESVRLSIRSVERLTGRVDVEDLLDVIFRDFCIGK
jgi:tRNA modification GTPase